MIKVDRSKSHCLVIGEHRFWPALRLLILLCLSGLYYYALFSMDGVLPAGGSVRWMLLLFPLFLTPYLQPIVRGLRHRDEFHFDTRRQRVNHAGQPLADFADIDKILIAATNSTCEELQLSLVLKSGRRVVLYEQPAGNDAYGLAQELAGLLGLDLESEISLGVLEQSIQSSPIGTKT